MPSGYMYQNLSQTEPHQLMKSIHTATIVVRNWAPALSVLGQSMWVASGTLSTYHAILTYLKNKTPFNTCVLASSAGSTLYSGSLLIDNLSNIDHENRHYLLPIATTSCTVAVIIHQYFHTHQSKIINKKTM